MLKFCSLSSGSSGNSYYISSETTAILVDAGISCARIQKSLAHIGEDIASVRAVFLTHEHSDHTSGLATLLKKHEIALYSTDGTRSELSFLSGVAVRCEPRVFESGASVRIGDIVVHSYPISHDARDPVCYKIESDCGAIVGIITDLGWADTEVIKAFYDCDLLLLESNHDVELLKIGPYPAFLKSRIIGKSGHLSNDDAGIIARNIIAQGRLRYLVLGHLSETNNHPDLARATVEQSVRERGFVSGEDYELDVMRRGQLGKMYLLRRTLILLMCALISVLNLVLMPMLNPPAFAEIRSDELLLREQVQYDIPVLSVAVVQGGERKLFFSRQLSEGALRDYDAPFQAGSMARVTTSLALLRLLEQRGITMEEPIRVHLPAELSKSLGEALDGVRFADLFLHTTGFTNNRYNTISEKPYSEDIRSRAQSYILRSEKKTAHRRIFCSVELGFCLYVPADRGVFRKKLCCGYAGFFCGCRDEEQFGRGRQCTGADSEIYVRFGTFDRCAKLLCLSACCGRLRHHARRYGKALRFSYCRRFCTEKQGFYKGVY